MWEAGSWAREREGWVGHMTTDLGSASAAKSAQNETSFPAADELPVPRSIQVITGLRGGLPILQEAVGPRSCPVLIS